MTHQRLLLLNPTMTARRNARFPLSLLTLVEQLHDSCDVTIIDGNIERDTMTALRQTMARSAYDAVGMTVMGGPQVHTAIELSAAIRTIAPATPIVWGGYFPTLYPDAAINAPYVDYLIRGQGEHAIAELLSALPARHDDVLSQIDGLSWKTRGAPVHNRARRIAAAPRRGLLRYELLGDPRQYLARTFLGQRTVAHQAALGCRFRCTFCGVAAMFRGAVSLPPAELLERDLLYLKHTLGADSVQYFDHNFFDREVDMIPLLEVMARVELPWWCYARADALLNLSASSWALVRRSRLRMAYIGAESPNDQTLHDVRKGTRSDQTLAVAELCREHGVVPELSFMVAPPVDTEAETERTFDFIRQIKRINPAAEIIVYIYTPIPNGNNAAELRDRHAAPVRFPTTPEEWATRPWVDYACHADAPWISATLRRRIRDFVTVLRCRFPTTQDQRSPHWAKSALGRLAAWRYRLKAYAYPFELDLAQRLIRLSDPRATSI
jgi:anaerobic magnesium-protoporphyrin IX monomethyl ester cyclase